MKKLLSNVSVLVLAAGWAASFAKAADTSFYVAPCTNPATGCEADTTTFASLEGEEFDLARADIAALHLAAVDDVQ